MRNILILVQNYLRCSIGSIKGKKNRAKSAGGIGTIILIFIGLGALIFMQAFSFGTMIKDVSAEAGVLADYTLLLYNGLIMGLVLVVFFSLQNITSGSRANDADLLLSMPLAKIQIVTAKAVAKFIIYFAINTVFSLPFVSAYFVFNGFSMGVAGAYLVVLILVPFLAVGFNYLLDYLTIVLFGRASFASILRTVLALSVVCGFIGIWIYIQVGLNPAISGKGQLLLFPPMLWFLEFVMFFDLISFMWILVISVVPFTFGIILLATTLDKQNIAMKKKAVNFTTLKNRSPLVSVFLKELKFYFNTPILMINTLVGVIFIIAFSGWLVIDESVTVLKFIEQVGLSLQSVGFVIAIAFSFMTALVFSSCTSISLEGRNFWILRTMPINTIAVLLGKALLNVVLVVPVLFVSSTVLFFVLKLSFFQFLIMFMTPFCVNIFVSFTGLYINLIYPKFDWESEQAVVKQSMSAIITSLLGIAVGLVPIIAVMIFGFTNVTLVALVCIGLLFIMAVCSVIILLTKGKSLYEKL